MTIVTSTYRYKRPPRITMRRADAADAMFQEFKRLIAERARS